jgi:hypothetical protein
MSADNITIREKQLYDGFAEETKSQENTNTRIG